MIRKVVLPVVIATLSLMAACSGLDDVVDTARKNIKNYLEKDGLYERGNIPENPKPALKGYYDIIGGAYRHITNDDREGRDNERIIEIGDVVSFSFDARIFKNSYDGSETYWTNIPDRIETVRKGNTEFDTSQWSSDPIIIRVGHDTEILKSLQNALPSCRPGDEVRIFLPPNVAYGNKPVDVVPAKSTLVFQLTNIEIIE